MPHKFPKKAYGHWAGNQRGTPYRSNKCAKDVWPGTGMIQYQCSRRNGHGVRGLFCKQHRDTKCD